jgi:hypothetical protein
VPADDVLAAVVVWAASVLVWVVGAAVVGCVLVDETGVIGIRVLVVADVMAPLDPRPGTVTCIRAGVGKAGVTAPTLGTVEGPDDSAGG